MLYGMAFLLSASSAASDTSTRKDSQIRRPGPQKYLRALGLHELDVKSNGDFLTHENPTRLECSVPGQSEVLSIDLCGCRDRDSRVAPGVFAGRRWTFHRKADLAGYPVNGKLAFDRQLSIPDDTDAFGFEGQGWKLLDIKEISALQVGIAL